MDTFDPFYSAFGCVGLDYNSCSYMWNKMWEFVFSLLDWDIVKGAIVASGAFAIGAMIVRRFAGHFGG